MPAPEVSTDRSLATTLPLVSGIVLIALALTESFSGLLAAVAAFVSAYLVLRDG